MLVFCTVTQFIANKEIFFIRSESVTVRPYPWYFNDVNKNTNGQICVDICFNIHILSDYTNNSAKIQKIKAFGLFAFQYTGFVFIPFALFDCFAFIDFVFTIANTQ